MVSRIRLASVYRSSILVGDVGSAMQSIVSERLLVASRGAEPLCPTFYLQVVDFGGGEGAVAGGVVEVVEGVAIIKTSFLVAVVIGDDTQWPPRSGRFRWRRQPRAAALEREAVRQWFRIRGTAEMVFVVDFQSWSVAAVREREMDDGSRRGVCSSNMSEGDASGTTSTANRTRRGLLVSPC